MKDVNDSYTVDMFETVHKQPSCLDAAYERKAIDDGLNSNPVFPENIEYLKNKYNKTFSCTS